jgi:tetratricopeptide (TPR) repeat protein
MGLLDQAMIGRKLLHYEILTRIGAGGMGEVWRAYDSRLDREVAIKILPREGADAAVLQQRFLREARAASALVHPNIITVHEINSAEGLDFIVMELVRGEALSAVLTRGRLPVAQAVEYAIQILEALRTAHEAGVVHRDLKPGNIMITPGGLVKVLDFGIAKRLADMPAERDATTAAPLTVAGVAIGTPAYMSPEQTLGDPIDARSDLFSFGVVLFQMLAGALPFQGTTSLSLVRQIVHDPPQPLRVLAPDVPEGLVSIVERCLAKHPADRYASAAAVSDDLRRVVIPSPAGAPAGEADPTRMAPGSRAGTPRRAAVPRWVGPAAAAAIVVVVAAWMAGPALMRWVRSRSTAAGVNATAPELHRRAVESLRFYYREGQLDQAIAQLEQALQLKTPYPLAEARLSLAYWRRNALSPDPQWQKQAFAYAERAVAGDAQLAIAHVAHGAALVINGEPAKAAAAYDRALTLDPANWELLWRMGDLAMTRKETAVAEQLYRRSVDAGPNEWEPYVRLGGFYYRQSRYQDALVTYEKGRSLAPDHARFYSNLGAVYHQLERTDEAARMFQRALEIAPDSITYSNLGTLLYFQGKYPEALSALERSVALGANTYLRWGNLADAARMTAGGQEKAHESYTRAIQLARGDLAKNPGRTEIRCNIALYLARDGQPKEALAELDRVLAQKDLAPAVLFNAALVAELAGQRPRALDLLGRALAGGYQLREIRQEPDLVKLRADPEYHKLASRYEK